MKICLVGAKLFHVDGLMDRQTDMMKLILVFKTFVNTLKDVHFHELSLHVGPSLGIG